MSMEVHESMLGTIMSTESLRDEYLSGLNLCKQSIIHFYSTKVEATYAGRLRKRGMVVPQFTSREALAHLIGS
jgi:hypothetical protein